MPLLGPFATPMNRLVACLALGLIAAAGPVWAIAPLPDPDGKPADMTKPVQVFILMGQSNMLGFGKVAGADKEDTLEYATKSAGLYPYLVDDAGNWTTRNDVRNVRVMVGRGGGMGVHDNEWLTIKGKAIGPEVGIGHQLGHLIDAPVMVLKSCASATAPFVLATLGQTKQGDGGNDGTILDAMLAVDGESGKHPEFKGNVATVYTNPISKGGASNGHYGGNAQTYMNVGEALGEAMVKLLQAGSPGGAK